MSANDDNTSSNNSKESIRSTDAIDLKNIKGAQNTGGTRFVSYLFSAAVADAVFPIFYIFLPLFAVTLGANALELGLVGGASYAVYSFMPLIMGHFSDRRGSRTFFILSSFVILCIVCVLYFIIDNPISLILTRMFEGIGWSMLWPAIEAAITEDSSRESKRSLTMYNYSWSAGAATGPALGTFLVTVFSYRDAFLSGGFLFAMLIILNSLVLLRNKPAGSYSSSSPSPITEVNVKSEVQSKVEAEVNVPLSLSSSVRKVVVTQDGKRNFRVWTSIATTALCSSASGVLFTFFGPYATSQSLTIDLVGAVTTAYGVARFLAYLSLARESVRKRLYDPAKRIRNLLILACIASLSSLVLMIKDPAGTLYFLPFILFSIGYSLVCALSQVTLIAETTKQQMGAGAGLFESSIGLGSAIGPIIAGAISSKSLVISFIVPSEGLVFVLGLLVVLFFVNKRTQREHNTKSKVP